MDRLNCELREDLKYICQHQAISLYAAYRSNSEEWILQMARAGIGFALMPQFTLPKESDGISFRILSNPAISRQVYAIQATVKPEITALLSQLTNASKYAGVAA